MTTQEYKNFKNLKPKENLRDNMGRLELIFNMLGEESATQMSRDERPQGFEESKKIAKRGGNVALAARKQHELESGKSIITPLNFRQSKELRKPEGA